MSKNSSTWKKSLILILILAFFAVFLLWPVIMILIKAFIGSSGLTFEFFNNVFTGQNIGTAMTNSIVVSLISAIITTVLGFIVAYTINYTLVPRWFKNVLMFFTMLPMFLPTITYGFAVIYAYGPMGIWTNLIPFLNIDVYGFYGLTMGFVIYTLPISFLLISNSMRYTDRRLSVVSRLLKDKPGATFYNTVLRPVLPAFVTSLIQCFFLSFTDFGIPTSLGGTVTLISDLLYNQMMGSLPNFNQGAVIALVMLVPAIISVILLAMVSRHQISADNSVGAEYGLEENKTRDWILGILSFLIIAYVISIFIPIFVVPFMQSWPYNLQPTFEHFQTVFSDNQLIGTFWNSTMVAVIVAIIGTVIAYTSALFTAREANESKASGLISLVAALVNTIPGMVLGIAYLITFSGSSLQGTFLIIIISNIVHYFSTPYLTIKDSLSKVNQNYEITSSLLGDGWFKTIFKVLVPNTRATIIEVFRYYFINSMVTVSAVIFLVNPATMLVTTKIKELQYFGQYSQIFVLSILLFIINFVVYFLLEALIRKESKNA